MDRVSVLARMRARRCAPREARDLKSLTSMSGSAPLSADGMDSGAGGTAVIPVAQAVPPATTCAQVSIACGLSVTTGSGTPPGSSAHQKRRWTYWLFGAAGRSAVAVRYGSPTAVVAQ